MYKFWMGPLRDEEPEAGAPGTTIIDNEESEESAEEAGEESSETDGEAGEEDTEEAKKERNEALNMYRLLKDPATSTNVIRILADKAGLLTGEPLTPKEEKAAKKDLKTIVKESLGPEYYGLLGERLEKIFEHVLESQADANQATQATLVENKVEAAFDKLASETKGASNQFKARMSQLADELQMAPGMSVEKYIRYLYNLASSERKVSATSKQITDKINRNANNAADRLSTSRGGTSTQGNQNLKDAPSKLKDIVAAALDSVSSGKRK